MNNSLIMVLFTMTFFLFCISGRVSLVEICELDKEKLLRFIRKIFNACRWSAIILIVLQLFLTISLYYRGEGNSSILLLAIASILFLGIFIYLLISDRKKSNK
jgi:hypothetical protein